MNKASIVDPDTDQIVDPDNDSTKEWIDITYEKYKP